MADPYVGQIMMVGFDWAPHQWAKCDGQLLPISSNTALFSLLGTQFGGNGRTTFALPDLRGRFPMHQGRGTGLSPRSMGQKGGAEDVVLDITQMPSHNHTGSLKPRASTQNANESSPADHYNAVETGGRNPLNGYRSDFNGEMGPTPFSTDNQGGNRPHGNMPPFQVINFIISLAGLYPPRS